MSGYKVSLVFPPHLWDDVHYVTPPIGLMSIGSLLEQAGMDVSVCDFIYLMRSGRIKGDKNVYKNAADYILETNPDAVGFYTHSATYPTCLNVARRIKNRRPGVKIVFGGHASAFLDVSTLQEFPWVDCVCRGEGEISGPRLFSALRDGSDLSQVRGVTYRTDNAEIVRNDDEDLIEDLDTLPTPALHLVPPLEEYRALGETLTVLIESGRGCTYNCVFCSSCRLWRHKVRYKSLERVMKDIQFYQQYRPDEFYLIHDFFTFDEQYVKDFCQALHDNDLRINWECRCRLNVSAETLIQMKEAGCSSVLYGVESGSQKMLKIMRKRIRFEDVYSTIRATIEAGIVPSLSFVVGLKEETIDDLNETLHLILMSELIGDCYPFVQIISPLPGTPIVKNYSHDFVLRKKCTAFSVGIEYDDGERLAEDQQLIEDYPAIFTSFYNIDAQVDIDYLREISRAFCVIQQLFAYIYFAYTEEHGITEIELYNLWRGWVLDNTHVNIGDIDSVTDREIWGLFDAFLAQDPVVGGNRLLRNLHRYSSSRYRLITCDEESAELSVEFDTNISSIIRGIRAHGDHVSTEDTREELLMRKNGFDIAIYKVTR